MPCLVSLLGLILVFSVKIASQQRDSFQKGQCIAILDSVRDQVKKHYYDVSFHGVDIDAKFSEARAKIRDVDSYGAAYQLIADALESLNDSHTSFIPPPVPFSLDYGFRHELIGNSSFIIAVRPGTDAEKQGVRPGDLLLEIDGQEVTRDSISKVDYLFNRLSPQESLTLTLASPDKPKHEVNIAAYMEPHKAVLNDYDILKIIHESEGGNPLAQPRFSEYGNDLLVAKIPSFAIRPVVIDSIMNKIRKYKSAILDLRGNPGGLIDSVEQLLDGMFQDPVVIGTRTARDSRKPVKIRGSGSHAFGGKVIVLVDSRSSSGAEIFARVMQLEKRGVVVGDRTAGQVMEAEFFGGNIGLGVVYTFGTTVTVADLIMSDGKSLEHAGVVPDEAALPTQQDLAEGRDPVLAHAASMLGVDIKPEDAGKLFPKLWPKM